MATLVASGASEAIAASMVGSGALCVWLEYGARRSLFFVCEFDRNLASVSVNIFPRLI